MPHPNRDMCVAKSLVISELEATIKAREAKLDNLRKGLEKKLLDESALGN